MFRLVQNHPATQDDFRSQRAERPFVVVDIPECLVRGISVYGDRADCDKTRKLPRFRGRFVCQVRLQAGAGAIQQTFRPSHHTWWPLEAFDILAHCEILAP